MSESGVGSTLEVTLLVLAVFGAQVVASSLGVGPAAFALSLPLEERVWTVVLSVYAHAGVEHLLANVVALLVVGTIIERKSSRARFHLFVVATGALSGVAEVLVVDHLGGSVSVLGISGAVFALMGYLVTSNPVATTLLGWLKLSVPKQLALMLTLAIAITWVTRGERVAIVAHFSGFMLGLVAGRLRLLSAR